MKKPLIIIIITALMLISVVLLTPKRANAEETQEITPFYGGDILNGKDLYLFEQYTTTPNFENGYISKKTISSQDVFYQDNGVLTQFNGWYKDLGMGLIDTYVESFPSATDFVFYIPFNGMLSRYFQLALWVDSTYQAYHYIKYVDENPIQILTIEDINKYLLMVDAGNKQIEWYAYEVKYPDYLPSFRPLTAQLAYQFGFDSGETEGFNSGYNSGRNYGYSQGYQQGLLDSAEHGYYQVLNFNQLVQNGNFANNSAWEFFGTNGELTIENGMATMSGFSNYFRQEIPDMVLDHKYYIRLFYRFNSRGTRRIIYFGNTNTYTISTNGFVKLSNVFTYVSGNTIIIANDTSNITTTDIKNVILMDLTAMYGEGNEPDLTTCDELFISSYYAYNVGTETSLNYLDGYNVGLSEGYNRGRDAQATEQLTATGWIQGIFAGLGSLLALQIFPGVTIGLIVGIPFVISLAYFVIRAFRGGGGA